MTGEKPNDESAPAAKEKSVTAASAPSAAPVNAAPAPDEPVDVSKLTAEEQMARFEKELKENDWGHQPC